MKLQKSALIEKIQEFLLELGRGFAFVARQKRIKTEHSDFYIDLVFYNYILKCFVVIDLKRGKLTQEELKNAIEKDILELELNKEKYE